MSARVALIIQHVPCETPGIIAEALEARGVGLEYVRPYQGEAVPQRIGRRAGLVVLGGPMAVYHQARYPFLRREIALIEDTLIRQRPILGVCLGSQLLATALGATVSRGRHKEIGWHPVTLGQPAAEDALWRGVPESFTAFHWHGDVFPLPRGAVRLAWSAATECQAFRHGHSAYGLLFHLEVTERIIGGMTRGFRQEPSEVGASERHILEGVGEHLPALTTIGRQVFGRWVRQVCGGEVPESEAKLHGDALIGRAAGLPLPATRRTQFDRAYPNLGAVNLRRAFAD